MKARMHEVLELLSLVVERVRAANARTEHAENRAAQMSAMLDALADENAALREELDLAEGAAARSYETIRSLQGQVEAGERLTEMLEARAAEAELRVNRAIEALGAPTPIEAAVPTAEVPRASVALH